MERRRRDHVVLAEQVRLLYAKAPMALATVPINAGLLVYVLWGVTPAERLFAFLIAAMVVTVGRALIWSQYGQRAADASDDERWAKLFSWGITLNGLVWGLGAVGIYPAGQVPHQVLIAFVIAGMAAGATVSAQSHLPALAAYIVTSVLPLVVRFAVDADKIHVVMAAMALLFALMMIAIGRAGSRRFAEAIVARLEREEAVERAKEQQEEAEQALAAERQVRGELARLRTLLDRAELGVLVVDAENLRVVDLTDGVLDLVGLPREQVLSPSITVAELPLASGYEAPKVWRELIAELEGGGSRLISVQRPSGEGPEDAMWMVASVQTIEEACYLLLVLRPRVDDAPEAGS